MANGNRENEYKPVDALVTLRRALETTQRHTSLEDILKEVEDRPLTREEIRDQKISWVLGMMPHGLEVTREQAEKWVDELP